MALFDYVLRSEGRSRRDVFASAARPAIVLIAVIGFMFALPRHRAVAPPVPRGPTEVTFLDAHGKLPPAPPPAPSASSSVSSPPAPSPSSSSH